MSRGQFLSIIMMLDSCLVTSPLAARGPDHLDGLADDTVLFNASGGPRTGLWTMSRTQLPPDPFYSGDLASGGYTFFNIESMVPHPNRTFLGDINGDGIADLVIEGFNGFQQLYVGMVTPNVDGFGTLADTPWTWVGMAESIAYFLADVNGDGLADPLTVSDANGTMLWEASYTQDGLFYPPLSTGYMFYGEVYSWAQGGTVQSPDRPLVGDFNGDGRADVGRRLASDADVAPGYVLIILSGVDGLDSSPGIEDVVQGSVANVVDDQGLPLNVTTLVGDMDGDGKDDIVEIDDRGHDGNYEFVVGLTGACGDASGLCIAPAGISWTTPFSPAPPGTIVNVPLLADLNGDGRDDLVVYREFPDPNSADIIGQWLVSFVQPGGTVFDHTLDAVGQFSMPADWAGNRPLVGQFRACPVTPCCHDPFADWEEDNDVDLYDFAAFQICLTGTGGAVTPECRCFDRDDGGLGDGDVDEIDVMAFELCSSGPAVPLDRRCDD